MRWLGIDGGGRYVGFAYGGGHGVALALGAAGDHDVGEDIGVLRHLVRYDGTDAAAADL